MPANSPSPLRPLLAMDTATPCARVAIVSQAGQCLAACEKTATRHSANLVQLCDEALHSAGLEISDLCAIACGAGPGSFTGLRVGMAVAKGLALPFDVKLVLVSSLDALADDLARLADDRLLVPCIDAGKGQVYGRVVASGQPVSGADNDLLLSPEELCALAQRAGRPVLMGGNGADRYLDVFQERLGRDSVRAGVPGPSATAVGKLAWARLARGEYDDLEHSVPRYGRPPDITRPKSTGP